jgi:syntaxin 1B/2/3
MEDRLADLKFGGRTPATAEAEPEEMMPAFNKKINAVQYYIKTVKENNARIAKLKEKHISATLTEQEKSISEELDGLIAENNKYCSTVKSELEVIEMDVRRAQEKEKEEPETRIKDITFRALKSKFIEVLKETQNTQIEYKTAVKGKISRQAKIIDPTLTNEQIEEVCNDPDGAGKLLANKMLGTGHMKLKNAVADIQDKYKDIRKLEKSVEIIHQLFIDMQMLVQAQGEMLDNIELNIQEAHDYTKKANVQLAKAKKSHQIAKKYKCCILITLVIIVVLVVAVPLATR